MPPRTAPARPPAPPDNLPSVPRVRRGNVSDQQAFRDEVASAALALYQRHGLAGVTMRAVAGEVGGSAMGLYRYYRGKSDLLIALWDHVLVDLLGQLREAVDRHSGAAERLRASIEAFVDYFETRADHFRLLYMTEQASDADASAEIRQAEIYRHLMAHGRALDEAWARELGATPTPEQFRLGMELRITLCVGYLHSCIVNRRLGVAERPALREQVVLSAVQGVERCLRGTPSA